MRSLRLAVLALVLGSLSLSLGADGLARAGGRPKVAILEIIIEGDAPAELRDQLDRSLAGGLYAAGYEVVPRADVAAKLRGAPELIGCLTTTCLSRIADMVGTRQFVRARVTANGAAYTFEIELLSADDSAGPVHRIERTCPVCTIDEANEMMSSASADLAKEQVAALPLHITSDPPGASLEIDGKSVGTAPFDAMLDPGEHTVRASMPGRLPSEHSVTVAAQKGGGAQTLAITLAADLGVDHGKTHSRFGVWKYAAVGGAVVGVATGLWLLSIDGDELDCPPAPATQCKTFRDTTTGGWMLTVGGVAAGAAATYMFLYDHPNERATHVGAALAPGGGELWVGGAF